jgi:acyl-coenzyme A thioesterase PaaI-like protein
MHLPSLIARSRRSAIARWWMNTLLNIMIPFNAPHGFTVVPQAEGGIRVNIPYRRINRNHIRGIHACAMATGAEMCSGLSLLEQLDPRKYRLIMRSIHMEYHFQARRNAHAICTPSHAEIAGAVIEPLRVNEKVDYTSSVRVMDDRGEHLATGTITWQVKEWSKVRTKR